MPITEDFRGRCLPANALHAALAVCAGAAAALITILFMESFMNRHAAQGKRRDFKMSFWGRIFGSKKEKKAAPPVSGRKNPEDGAYIKSSGQTNGSAPNGGNSPENFVDPAPPLCVYAGPPVDEDRGVGRK